VSALGPAGAVGHGDERPAHQRDLAPVGRQVREVGEAAGGHGQRRSVGGERTACGGRERPVLAERGGPESLGGTCGTGHPPRGTRQWAERAETWVVRGMTIVRLLGRVGLDARSGSRAAAVAATPLGGIDDARRVYCAKASSPRCQGSQRRVHDARVLANALDRSMHTTRILDILPPAQTPQGSIDEEEPANDFGASAARASVSSFAPFAGVLAPNWH
jgi:hypothetical protein